MKHEEKSFKTKKILSTTLKNLMEKETFSKITITKIVKEGKLNRKTFYYHFENISQLLKWTLEEEAFAVIKGFDLLNDYKEAINFVVDYVSSNSHVISGAYNSLGRETMKEFFHEDFTEIISIVIDAAKKDLNINVSDEFKLFLAHMYTESISGVLIEQFQNPCKNKKEETIQYLSLILKTSIPAILKQANEKNL